MLFNCTCFGEQEKLLEIAVPFSFPLHCLSREYEASVFAVKTFPPHSFLRLSLQRWCQKKLHFYPFSPLWQKTRNFAKGEKRFTACFWARQFGCGVCGARGGNLFAKIHAHCSKHPKGKKRLRVYLAELQREIFSSFPPFEAHANFGTCIYPPDLRI